MRNITFCICFLGLSGMAFGTDLGGTNPKTFQLDRSSYQTTDGVFQLATGEIANRSQNVLGDPCLSPLPTPCPEDVDGDGSVSIGDILLIIGDWGTFGDGTFRPIGDCSPLPDGDCVTDIGDLLACVAAWDADCSAPVPGDECVDAIVAFIGANAFDTTAMTPSQPQPNAFTCSDAFLGWKNSQDIWFVWTATATGTATFSTCDPTSYDTSMVLYAADCDTQLACSGDGTGGTGCQQYYSRIADFSVEAGSDYAIRLGGWNGATGQGTLTITMNE